MISRNLPEKFLVAFSFAGEQRELVKAIAEAVEKRLGRSTVFFDEWYEHYIAGHDADLRLQKIYIDGCLLAIVCVSERYGNKPWTRAEHRAIRARQMKAETLNDEQSKYQILPIRVGDGEVEGILFNTIVPDVRTRRVSRIVQLIIDRLQLISSDDIPEYDASAVKTFWPETVPALYWPMANHKGVRDAFSTLLRRDVPRRFLPLRGTSESGKSHITWQMFDNVRHVLELPCGRFDFKGTTTIDEEMQTFSADLNMRPPPAGLRLTERFSHLLNTLKQSARPALLIFDTYEVASNEAQGWVERQLLPSLIRATWLRVV
ncbi:MAG TPA: TIR domain-containing protein, partial [Nitrosospira sp.]|nr:TIR domain-containing protein [Nitrosospira sp.]